MVFSKPLVKGFGGQDQVQHPLLDAASRQSGGRYPFEDGRIVVDSIAAIDFSDVTEALARESGFATVQDLLDIARHGTGENIYLIRFRYLRPGDWEEEPGARATARPVTGARPGLVCSLSHAGATHPPARHRQRRLGRKRPAARAHGSGEGAIRGHRARADDRSHPRVTMQLVWPARDYLPGSA